MNDSKQRDSWFLATKAHARIHDFSEVLDSLYVPVSPYDRLIFNEKKAFMYAVFTEVLLNDKEKSLVLHQDVQKFHIDRLAYAETY